MKLNANQKLGLLIEKTEDCSWSSEGYWHVNGRLVIVDGSNRSTEDCDEGEVTWPDRYGGQQSYESLQIHSQGGMPRGKRTHLYHYSFRWRDIYALDLEEAEGIVKLGRKIKKAMDKIKETEGYSPNFATYVARICRILGVKLILRKSPNDWSGYRYQAFPVGRGVDWLQSLEREAAENEKEMV